MALSLRILTVPLPNVSLPTPLLLKVFLSLPQRNQMMRGARNALGSSMKLTSIARVRLLRRGLPEGLLLMMSEV